MKKSMVFLIIALMITISAYSAEENPDAVKNPEPAGENTDEAEKNGVSETKSIEELQEELKRLKYRLTDLEKKFEQKRIDDENSLKFSGFFDVSISNYKNQPNIFQLGDFELDISHSFKNHFQVAAALVFNKGAELGVGFIDYHIYGGSISPRGRLFKEKGIHIQVGKFDVPFGNDWQYLTSVSSLTVTAPVTTEMIMEGGYNDVGIRFLANFVFLNFTVYALRGIEAGYSYGGNSFGGRLGFTPFNNPYRLKTKVVSLLDIGVSYIHDFDKQWATAEMLVAVDLETIIGPVSFRTEYYRRDKTVGLLYQGFHITLGLDFDYMLDWPFMLYSRYGYYLMTRYKMFSEENNLSRFTCGIKINMYNISYLKFEYIRYIDAYSEFRESAYYGADVFYIQLMITF